MYLAVFRWVIGLSLLLMVAGGAASEASQITVEVYPTSLELPFKGSAEATLVVRNPTEFTARGVEVNHTDLAGVTVKIEPASASPTIPSKSAFTWTLKIAQAGAGIVLGDVTFQVHYTLADNNGTKIKDVVFSKITVRNREQSNASQILAVTVHSTLSELNDLRPGYIYLKAENKSGAPIEITKVSVAEPPDFIELSASKGKPPLSSQDSVIVYGGPTQIPAGESRVFPVYVKSGDKIRPGEHMLMFNVFFRRTVNGETQTGSVVAEHKVKVKVFGEEEVLGALASVTTFLFVPGFLMIVIAGMVWKWLVPLPTKEKFPFSVSSGTIVDPRFWVSVITLSLLMAWEGYPTLSTVFLPMRRDFLYGYGFQDIIWMWLFSILIGVTPSVLVAVMVQVGQDISARKAINPADDPMKVLKKIRKQGFNEARFKKAIVIASNKAGFLIEHERPQTTALWIAPRMTIWWYEEAGDLRDTFEDLVEQKDTSLSDLFKKLETEMRDGKIEKVVWAEKEGYIDRPTRVDKSGLQLSTSEESPFLHEFSKKANERQKNTKSGTVSRSILRTQSSM